MITVQKFVDTETAMNDPAWQNTQKILEELNTNVYAALKQGMKTIEGIYAPLTDTWNVWCVSNLTSGERTKIKNIYNSMKSFVALVEA